MSSLGLTSILLLSCAVQAAANTYVPATPTVFTVNFGAATLFDTTQLPGFTFIFSFNDSLAPSNFATGFTFQMDNSEMNPNTGMAFTPAPVTVLFAPTVTATSIPNGEKPTWTFDAVNSFITVTSTSVEIGVQYDPPDLSVFYDLIIPDPLPIFTTPESTTVKDQGGRPATGTQTTTVKTATQPEPTTFCLLGAGLALMEVHRRRRRGLANS
jgi:hypothetical protein